MKSLGNTSSCLIASAKFVSVTRVSQIAQKSTRPLCMVENRSFASITKKQSMDVASSYKVSPIDRHNDGRLIPATALIIKSKWVAISIG